MQVILHIEQIVMLEITECVEMETDEDRHYFRTTHCPLALSVLASIGGRYCRFLYFCIIFFAKIINNKISVILSLVISIILVSFNL